MGFIGIDGGRKEGNGFYLTMHSTHFIYGYMASDMWLRTILIVRGNPLLTHRLHQGFFYIHHPTDRIAHTMAFVTPVVEHWLRWRSKSGRQEGGGTGQNEREGERE